MAKRRTAMKNTRQPIKKASAPADSLLSMEEAIEMLKTTRPTFYRWLKTGKLRGMKVGRQWRFYAKDVEGFLRGEGLRYDLPVGVEPVISALRAKIGEKGASLTSLSDSEKIELASELVIRVGTTLKASDIHIDTVRETGRLRYRINGILVMGAEFDAKLVPALVTRFKVLGKCDVNIHNLPQDSRIKYTAGETGIDLLMCFLPSLSGETLTMRLLDINMSSLTVDQMLPTPVKDEVISGLAAPYGLIVMAGPTGSGKTSTLYACVNHLAKPEKKVVSIEDPLEYAMPGVVQVGVNKNIGMTAANALRAVLRSDPNIIVVGEIKDAETADLACKAAMTGHLVLANMHARNTGHVLSRLMDLGIEPYTLAETLVMVTGQRLVRKVCRDCSANDSPPEKALAEIREAAESGGANWQAIERKFRRNVGCPKCNMTGFKGRALAMELMRVKKDVAAAIREGNPDKVRERAIAKGMVTIEAEAVRLAGEGITTVEEAIRVIE